jgi:hypothetical protein
MTVRLRRVRWYLLVAGVLLAWLAFARVAEAANGGASVSQFDQCENTPSGVGDCTGSAWINGGLNANKALYREGDFVPLRVEITGLTAGRSYTLAIEYEAVGNHGDHAYDYLGSYDGSEHAPGQMVVPCDGITGTAGPNACGSAPSTLSVPVDTDTHFLSGKGQVPGIFSAWGGQLTHAAYVSPTPIYVNMTGAVTRVIAVSFTANGPTVVLAWGGHLASSLDWGAGNSFLANSGASVQMALGTTDTIGSGEESLAINTGVLASPASLSTTVAPATPPPVAVGQTVTDTASLSGTPVPEGSVAFFVCRDATANPDCSTGGTAVGDPNIVAVNGNASIEFIPTTPGFYCFRAEYTPSIDAPYSPVAHTNMTSECFAAITAPLLTVAKICDPATDTGVFNLLIDNNPAFPNAPCGASTGPAVESVGPHTVSETAGTGTNLSDYASTTGGDCAANGSVTLAAGQSATCTITNVRKPPPTATLTVNKVCEPASDTGLFDLFIDATGFADVACGGTTGPETVAVGSHTVSEQAGTGTSLGDYTSVTGGACAPNGAITLTAGESATCTITNTRTATLTVEKVCDPANDPGRFNLMIDGATAGTGANVGCGGSTGAVAMQPGPHSVGETAADGTDLANYTTTIAGDCAASGTVTVTPGEQATCTITNVHSAAPTATLTVNKVCQPATDTGLFDLFIDATGFADVACGGTTGPETVAVGSHTVGEQAGTGTSLGDYTSVIGGACAANETITLVAGQSATCTITNARKPMPAMLTVEKVCDPANDPGRFNLMIDGATAGAGANVGCGGSTGAVAVQPGPHTVGETGADGTDLANYTATVGGECAADGSITLVAGQSATCTITNTRKPPPTATLTVYKVCVPASETGLFELNFET